MRPLPVPLGLNHVHDLGFARIQTPLIENETGELIEDTLSQPLKFKLAWCFLSLLSLWSIFELDGPKLLRDKFFDFFVSVDNKPQSRELTGPIAHNVIVFGI